MLWLDSEPLAQAIADEWQAAGDDLRMEDVPLTRLAGTAQERVSRDPGASVAALSRYAESDLLCYRAERPDALVLRQARMWQPWLDWAASRHGAALLVTEGVLPVEQPAEAVAALRAALASHPAFHAGGAGIVVPATGSLVLGAGGWRRARWRPGSIRAGLPEEAFSGGALGRGSRCGSATKSVWDDIALAARFIRLSMGEGRSSFLKKRSKKLLLHKKFFAGFDDAGGVLPKRVGSEVAVSSPGDVACVAAAAQVAVDVERAEVEDRVVILYPPFRVVVDAVDVPGKMEPTDRKAGLLGRVRAGPPARPSRRAFAPHRAGSGAFPGGRPRRINRTCLSRKTTMPTPTSGRSGYSRLVS